MNDTMNDTMMALVCIDARDAAKDAPTTEAKLRAAMKSAANHWMVLDAGIQQRGAIAAVLDLVGLDSDDGRVLQAELRVLNALNASSAGVPVDFGTLMDNQADKTKWFGLSKLWREVSDAR